LGARRSIRFLGQKPKSTLLLAVIARKGGAPRGQPAAPRLDGDAKPPAVPARLTRPRRPPSGAGASAALLRRAKMPLRSGTARRRSWASWSLCSRMYAHTRLVSSVRGSGSGPTMAAKVGSGRTGWARALGALLAFGAAFFWGCLGEGMAVILAHTTRVACATRPRPCTRRYHTRPG
jgi:hypothetical protein